jgi:hypothetical protein
MNEKKIAEIEARANAATPGLWIVNNSRHVEYSTQDSAKGCQILEPWDEYYSPGWDTDAEFIANARQDIPALLSEVRRLRAVVEEYAHRQNWQRWKISNADLWILDEYGYTRAEECLREDGE